MKIVIVGGSRGTGARLASLAQGEGHEVTVLSRSGGPVTPGVETLKGDAGDPEVAARAVAGADAVVVTVGGAKGTSRQRSAVTRVVVAAMQEAGVRRLVVQSSLGAGGSAAQMPALVRVLTRVVLASALADHDEQESAVVTSDLDWTIVRPAGLTNGPTTGGWTARELTKGAKGFGSIPRGDLAACLLRVLEDDSTVGRAFGVSNS